MASATWTRDHPWAADVAFTVTAALFSLASVFYVATLVGWAAALVLHVVPPVAISVRRGFPCAVTTTVLLLDIVTWGLSLPYSGAQLATLIAIYTVARERRATVSVAFVGAAMVLIVVAPLRQPFTDAASVIAALAAVVLVYLLGRTVELRTQYLLGLEEHSRRLERERDADLVAAAEHERLRIAREMHDVVAHHVSVMVVQAEGAAWAIDDDPESARTAVSTIADTGRSALTELRLVLGVLRDGTEHDAAPQPGLADLEDLIDRFRGSGITVRSDVAPSGLALPASVEVAAFRVVQEALTNVLKHAGPTAVVDVAVTVDESVLLVTVTDDGGEDAHTRVPSAAGHGLTGIAERTAMFGGTARSGRRPDGGFDLSVSIPCR
ncbi:two-component sensor histidine kinase [Rhodococcoides trifolii]|uniref:histidine kinase n=1 Tax=Rhodococcoides trifolii TaxID=908250 RepID=A0A917FR42_9NOCA|nr:histidine kinase [Rhodococcus trifolii]GGF96001.1 two-component sensor histidine kinase [Rhodococcus trifolii]